MVLRGPLSQSLHGQAVGDGERRQVLLELGGVDDLVAGQAFEVVEPLDLLIDVLLEELLQAGELEPVAQADDLADLRLAVHARIEPDGPADLAGEVVEDAPHGGEHGAGVGGLGGVALQVFGLGEGELQLLGEGAGEVVAADRHVALPDAGAVGDDQVGVVGSDVQQDVGVGLIGAFGFGRRVVEGDIVVEGQGAHLHDVDLDPGVLQGQDGAVDLVAFHGEQTDLGHGELLGLVGVAADGLVVPDDLFEGEGDLLAGLELHDVGDALLVDRRQLDELHQPRLARDADGDPGAGHLVPAQEGGERLAHQFFRVGVGLAENLGVFDVVERLGQERFGVLAGRELQGLECGLSNVDGPDGLDLRHANQSPERIDTWAEEDETGNRWPGWKEAVSRGARQNRNTLAPPGGPRQRNACSTFDVRPRPGLRSWVPIPPYPTVRRL